MPPFFKITSAGFPLIHSSPFIEVNVINDYSLLYKIRGSDEDKSGNSLPYLLAAHMDVVPVANGTWKIAEPFAGSIIDGVIYGRGALDDKSSVMVSNLPCHLNYFASWRIRG